jgi:hypothetical protein
MLAFRCVQQGNHCAREEFLYTLKAGPAGGRLRRPSSAGSTTTIIGAPTMVLSPAKQAYSAMRSAQPIWWASWPGCWPC